MVVQECPSKGHWEWRGLSWLDEVVCHWYASSSRDDEVLAFDLKLFLRVPLSDVDFLKGGE